jgi:hypothetical protein
MVGAAAGLNRVFRTGAARALTRFRRFERPQAPRINYVAYSLIYDVDKRQAGPENAARRAEFRAARVDKILQSAILRRLRDRGPSRRPPGWNRHHNA